MTINVFAVPVFFVVFREMLETVVIVSVLLAFLKQTLGGPNRDDRTYKKLVKQVWYGTFLGLLIVLIVGAIFIAIFYRYGKDKWGSTEYKWEGGFAIVATVIISVVGAALLRVSKMQEKWRVKLANHVENGPLPGYGWQAFKVWCERYVMFAVPFLTILREGLEAVIFIAGVSFSAPASAVPLPVVMGVIAGTFVGYLIYKGGASAKLQAFLIVSTCFLYLIAAGLFSKAVWYLQQDKWNKAVGTDAAELGAGAGSYDIGQSVWHVNFGNPELNGGGGWGIFNAILGWQNSATYGSVISYNVYWIIVVIGFLVMRYKENTGHLPFMKSRLVLSLKSKGFPFSKSKNQEPVHPKEELSSVINTSNASSSIFERGSSARTDPEKAITTVHAAPTRTNSE